jgi:hypothetical protein
MLPAYGTVCGKWPYGGYYDNINKIVYVCELEKWKVDVSNQMIVDHEISHFIQDNLITEKEWTDYQREWAKSMSKGKTQFLRDYGMTNAKEGFAEDAMYLQAWQYIFNRDPQVRKRVGIVRKAINRMK